MMHKVLQDWSVVTTNLHARKWKVALYLFFQYTIRVAKQAEIYNIKALIFEDPGAEGSRQFPPLPSPKASDFIEAADSSQP